MAEDITQNASLEANPVNGAENTPQNEGNQTTIPQVEKHEGKTFTQQDLDNIAAKARGAAERETRRKLLAELGLKDDEVEKLSAMKQAYQDSLSDEEKRNIVMEELQADNLKLSQDLEEKDYTIKALVALTGKNEDDVTKIVKMAKGLKNEDNSIEEAINEVIEMIKPQEVTPAATISTPEKNPDMPIGQSIQQPSKSVVIDTTENPFKPGSINLTKQGQLIKENPNLAIKLANEAGVRLNF